MLFVIVVTRESTRGVQRKSTCNPMKSSSSIETFANILLTALVCFDIIIVKYSVTYNWEM